MKKAFYTLFSLGLMFSGFDAFSQQDAQFSQYMFNTLYYNPAFSGVEGVTKFSALHRSQWVGYEPTSGSGGPIQTQMALFTTPILKFRSGFGAMLMHDEIGFIRNNQAQVSYAYHLGLRNSKLSFGMRAGIYSQTIDYDEYRYIHENDPNILTGKESQVRPDLALGFFYRAEKYFAGVSFNHILKSEFDFGLDSARNALENHSFLTADMIMNLITILS